MPNPNSMAEAGSTRREGRLVNTLRSAAVVTVYTSSVRLLDELGSGIPLEVPTLASMDRFPGERGATNLAPNEADAPGARWKMLQVMVGIEPDSVEWLQSRGDRTETSTGRWFTA